LVRRRLEGGRIGRRASRTPLKWPLSSPEVRHADVDLPDARGHFGPYGGVFVAESFGRRSRAARAYAAGDRDSAVEAEFRYELKHYVGRPMPDYHARPVRAAAAAAQIYIKREDLNHTGAHQDQQHHRAGAARRGA